MWEPSLDTPILPPRSAASGFQIPNPRSPPKKLPSLPESQSAPMLPERHLEREHRHVSPPVEREHIRHISPRQHGLPGHGISPYLEDTAAVRRMNRRLEAELARVTEQLYLERRERKAADEQRAAEREALTVRMDEEVSRLRAQVQQQLAETEAGSAQAAEEKVETLKAKYKAEADARERHEKKARIELLKRQVARRMMSRGISLGFTAWVELWEAKTYAMQRLREVANKLRAPGMEAAFASWSGWAREAKMQAQLVEASQRANELQAQQGSLESTLAKLRAEYDAKLRAAEEDKRVALERQMVELTGSAAQRAELMEARAREERIELLRRQTMRRMMNAGLLNAWNAWQELWSAKVYSLERLRQVANLLRAPAVSSAFAFWGREAQKEREASIAASAEASAAALAEQTRGRRALEAELSQVRRELAAAESERAALRAKVEEIDAVAATQIRARAELEQVERDARIELLKRQVARRMMSRGISLGFTAWVELWEAKTYAMQRLREVANKLRAPGMEAAFASWSGWAREAKMQAQLVEASQRANELQAQQGSLESTLAKLRAEYDAKLRAAEEDKRVALERQMVELTGSAAQRAELMEARAREERIELLRRQTMRRMMNAGLLNAWNAWQELWSAKVYSLERLRQVANFFRAPQLANAFAFWARHTAAVLSRDVAIVHQEKAAALTRERDALQSQLDALRAESEAKLAEAVAERLTLLARVSDLSGSTVDTEALVEAATAAEREKRIELLKRQVVRRIGSRSLALGFTAWVEMWEARAFAMDSLRRVANTMRAPEVAFAFGVWSEEAEGARAAQHESAQATRERDFDEERRAFAEELRAVRAECDAKLAAALDEKNAALERMLIELNGSAEAKAELQAQRDREERVALLTRQIARRILSQDLVRGWTAWVEGWEAKSYAMMRLRQVAGRLRGPELAAAFASWAQYRVAKRRAAEKAALSAFNKSLEGRLQQAEFEAGQMRMVKVAQEDELHRLQAKLAHVSEVSKERDAALKAQQPELDSLSLEVEHLREELRAAQTTASSAQKLREESEASAATQRSATQELLERLLAEQRAAFASEQSEAKSTLDAEVELRRDLEEQLRAAKQQSQEQLSRARDEIAQAQLQVEQLQAELANANRAAAAAPKPSVSSKEKKPARKGVLGEIDLDEGPDAPPISEQLASALRASAGRVMDLLREWDADGEPARWRGAGEAAITPGGCSGWRPACPHSLRCSCCLARSSPHLPGWHAECSFLSALD